jgi:hypothetical protein
MIRLPRDTEARHGGVLVTGPFETLLVHAYEREGPGLVVVEPYRGWLVRRTAAAFRFPGVTD